MKADKAQGSMPAFPPFKLRVLLTWSFAVLASSSSDRQSYWRDLAARLHTGSRVEPPHEFFRSIEEDLKPWQAQGISFEQVEAAYCNSPGGGFRLQIIAGRVYIVGEGPGIEDRHRNLKLMLLHLQGLHTLPDVDIGFFCTDDGAWGLQPSSTCPSAGPVFAFAKRQGDADVVRFPDWNFFDWPNAHLLPWEDLSNVMLEHSKSLPWSGKVSQLFGRAARMGSTRAVLHDNQNDLSVLPAWQVRIGDWKNEPGLFASLLQHCKYKYLLHTAGNTYSGRLKFLTLCSSAIIFPQDDWQEFWYGMLNNGSNIYMVDRVTPENKGAPILEALSDLQADDELASRLAQGSHTLAYEVLSKHNINLYMLRLLNEYSRLLKFKVVRHPDAVQLEESLMGAPATLRRTCSLCPFNVP